MRWLLVSVLSGFVLASASCLSVFAVASEVDAVSAVDVARVRLVGCYGVLVGAESAGGNVSVLAGVLDEAGGLLSGAEVALKRGDFDVAVELSSDCVSKLEGFNETAIALRDDASRQRYLDFMVNVVGSVVGTSVVVVGGWGAWVYLKRKFGKAEGAV